MRVETLTERGRNDRLAARKLLVERSVVNFFAAADAFQTRLKRKICVLEKG